MGLSQTQRRRHLRVVARNNMAGLPALLEDSAVRAEVEQLTEALIDALIEMVDLMDGDPDIEANGDEAEEGDGI